MKHAPVLLALLCAVPLIGRAASPPALPASLVGCSRMADPAARLQCYDEQMAALGVTAPTPPPQVNSPAPARPTGAAATVTPPPDQAPAPKQKGIPAPTPASKFGEEDLKLSARTPQTEADTVLVSKITSIREARPKLFIIVLANGQIWMQEGTQITMFFRPGYDVRIEKGLFGHYRMSSAQVGEKDLVTVTRIQ